MNTSHHLPMGGLSNVITDSTSGTVPTVRGSVQFTVTSVAAFLTDMRARDAVKEAIADEITGVSKENIQITQVVAAASGGRRLGAHAAGGVVVHYLIYVPAALTAAGTTISSANINAATLKTKLIAKLQEKAPGEYTVSGDITVAASTTSTV